MLHDLHLFGFYDLFRWGWVVGGGAGSPGRSTACLPTDLRAGGQPDGRGPSEDIFVECVPSGHLPRTYVSNLSLKNAFRYEGGLYNACPQGFVWNAPSPSSFWKTARRNSLGNICPRTAVRKAFRAAALAFAAAFPAAAGTPPAAGPPPGAGGDFARGGGPSGRLADGSPPRMRIQI